MNDITDTILVSNIPMSFVIRHDTPAAYRLARINGELVLQGLMRWEDHSPEGIKCGADWETIPTVELT